ncbi:WD40 repeat-like protein [Laetiporus sulphureus 93-53]|uniref:WD40 repeat-like protein n=1 Tax=Laetiporus sulphureus 93-53 TaxID=1314785 RepID=A0A165HTY4_9APHY|nr:WD40 repeat-like protein [Laetiporus sulphureus 93-53]KZT12183.1 WD40 repeat-like protein [Laetiporus sulphureus 93-53]
MDACSLVLPITLMPIIGQKGLITHGDVLDYGCTSARPSCLHSWTCLPSETADDHCSSRARRLAVGCEDGTLYLFRTPSNAACRRRASAAVSPDLTDSSRSASPRFLSLSAAHSRSASPSSNRPITNPFQLTRSRVIASVSAEQVEAPKTYVDFDDEPEKLKGMLKGKSMKEKAFNVLLSPGTERNNLSDKEKASSTSGKRRLRALSPATSGRSRASSVTPPNTSAAAEEPDDCAETSILSLSCHVFPPSSGSAGAVAAINTYDNGRFIILLSRTGDVSAHVATDGSCVTSLSIESEGIPVPAYLKRSTPSLNMWVWKGLHMSLLGESNMLFACASSVTSYSSYRDPDPTNGETEAQMLVVAFEIQMGPHEDGSELRFVKVGAWCLDGFAGSLGLHEQPDGSVDIFYVSSLLRMMRRKMSIIEDPQPSGEVRTASGTNIALQLAIPFKALKALSGEREPDSDTEDESMPVTLAEATDVGEVALRGSICGLRVIASGLAIRVACWSESELILLEVREQVLAYSVTMDLADIHDIHWINEHSFSVVLPDRAETHIWKEVDADSEVINNAAGSHATRLLQPVPLRKAALPLYDSCLITSDGQLIYSTVKNGRRRIRFVSMDGSTEQAEARTLWKASSDSGQIASKLRVTASLPVELNLIILGCGDGRLRRTNFAGLLGKADYDSLQISDVPLQGEILALYLVEDERTNKRYIVGGADDGTVAIWELESLKLRARWTMFTTSLVQVIHLYGEDIGRLRGCVLCISQDGTIATIAVDSCQMVFIVPASSAPLSRIYVGEDNLLLLYADGRARLWDSKTREFWRSMSAEKVDELMKQGGWNGWSVKSTGDTSKAVVSSLPCQSVAGASSTVLVDVVALIRQSTGIILSAGAIPSNTNIEQKRPIDWQQLALVLSAVLTPGLSNEIDRICREKLGAKSSCLPVGYAGNGTTSVYNEQSTPIWCASPEVSAARSVAILGILNVFMQNEALKSDTSTVMTSYATSLAEAVGTSYQSPSLSFLTRQWLQSIVLEIRNASRSLFDIGVARLTDEEAVQAVEYWQAYLPCAQPDAEECLRDAMALHICGYIAIQKYSLLSASVLTDIARSIAQYLHDESSSYRALAIELCSRGFPVWQQYVDAVEMLRALFTLATASRKDSISPHNIGAQARSAVLQIATANTPLFMTTLTIDILQPRSVQHRRSVMQLVILLIRKNPMVLYSNLPRLMEAIVKSLDPNSTADRDAVLDSATDILRHVVQTFPTVDFHSPTQRLAVGTSEGAVVMYDLKTATRLYVLEGHKKRTTACSFSPDGRRLVTVSLEESVVLVWKVGSSFTSFFIAGAPPRQGHAGSGPYKTLGFNVGDEAQMSLIATLTDVRFEWLADRSVRLRIRESALTFST